MSQKGRDRTVRHRGAAQSDGMDAPLHNGIKRAKVVVSSSHFTEEERPR